MPKILIDYIENFVSLQGQYHENIMHKTMNNNIMKPIQEITSEAPLEVGDKRLVDEDVWKMISDYTQLVYDLHALLELDTTKPLYSNADEKLQLNRVLEGELRVYGNSRRGGGTTDDTQNHVCLRGRYVDDDDDSVEEFVDDDVSDVVTSDDDTSEDDNASRYVGPHTLGGNRALHPFGVPPSSSRPLAPGSHDAFMAPVGMAPSPSATIMDTLRGEITARVLTNDDGSAAAGIEDIDAKFIQILQAYNQCFQDKKNNLAQLGTQSRALVGKPGRAAVNADSVLRIRHIVLILYESIYFANEMMNVIRGGKKLVFQGIKTTLTAMYRVLARASICYMYFVKFGKVFRNETHEEVNLTTPVFTDERADAKILGKPSGTAVAS